MDVKERIEFVKGRLKYLKWYHVDGDDYPFGSGTVQEAKRRFRKELKTLKAQLNGK